MAGENGELTNDADEQYFEARGRKSAKAGEADFSMLGKLRFLRLGKFQKVKIAWKRTASSWGVNNESQDCHGCRIGVRQILNNLTRTMYGIVYLVVRVPDSGVIVSCSLVGHRG